MVLNGACELDVLPSGSGRPEVGSLFTRHAREFGSRPGEGPEERRARLAHLLRRDESDSGGGGGVVWFTHELVAHAYNHIMSSSFVRNRNSPATALMREFMEECPLGGFSFELDSRAQADPSEDALQAARADVVVRYSGSHYVVCLSRTARWQDPAVVQQVEGDLSVWRRSQLRTCSRGQGWLRHWNLAAQGVLTVVRAASEIDLYHVASGSKHGARPEVTRLSKAVVKKKSNGKMQKRVEAGTARSEAAITRFFQTIKQRVNVAGQNECFACSYHGRG